jgi:hypothetical protein
MTESIVRPSPEGLVSHPDHGLVRVPPAGYAGGPDPFVATPAITGYFEAAAYDDVIVDTTNGPATILLPAVPAAGSAYGAKIRVTVVAGQDIATIRGTINGEVTAVDVLPETPATDTEPAHIHPVTFQWSSNAGFGWARVA